MRFTSALPQFDLFGVNALPSYVISTHSKISCFGLFSGMGHGSKNEFEGQFGINLYDMPDTNKANRTVKGAIVHLYSCDCGQGLGPHLVTLGARAFIGYTQPVNVPKSQSMVEEFVRISVAIDESILNSDSATTTKTKADAEFNSVEARLLASPATSPRELALFRLNHRGMVGPWTDPTYRKYGWF